MLKVTHPAPNRIDLELSAVLDGGMMAAALDELVDASKEITDGVMMYRIPSFSWPTGGAIAAEFMRLPQLFEMVGHFKRCAVVTDIGWIQKAAEVEGKMMPGLEIKAFDMDEAAEAEAWLEGRATQEADNEKDDFEDNMPV